MFGYEPVSAGQSAVCIAVWAGNAMSTSIAHVFLSMLCINSRYLFQSVKLLLSPLQCWLRRCLGRDAFELRILLDNTMVDIMYLQLQNTCHVSVMGKTVCISTSTVLATVQVASPSGRAVFELRGLPENTTVDLKVCGPIESGGTMSIYRDGAFLWCAIRNVT